MKEKRKAKWLHCIDSDRNNYIWFRGKNSCLSQITKITKTKDNLINYDEIPERTIVKVDRDVYVIEVIEWLDKIPIREGETIERYEERISQFVNRIGDWWHSYIKIH